ALAMLQRALAAVRIRGIGHNVRFLRRLLSSQAFHDGDIDTGYIERQLPQLLQSPPADGTTELQVLAAAALWSIAHEERSGSRSQAAVSGPPRAQPPSPWEQTDGWRLQGRLVRRLRFEWAQAPGPSAAPVDNPEIELHYRSDGYWVRVGSAQGT